MRDVPPTKTSALVWRQCLDHDGVQWSIEVSNEFIRLSSLVVSRANEKILVNCFSSSLLAVARREENFLLVSLRISLLACSFFISLLDKARSLPLDAFLLWNARKEETCDVWSKPSFSPFFLRLDFSSREVNDLIFSTEWIIYFPSYANGGRRTTAPTTPKHSWSNSSSSTSCKPIADGPENFLLSPPTISLPRNQQSDLTSYLSRRRNTTGSISLNKIVDLKNTPTGNILKSGAGGSAHSSNHGLSTESKQSSSLAFELLFVTNTHSTTPRHLSNRGGFRSAGHEAHHSSERIRR